MKKHSISVFKGNLANLYFGYFKPFVAILTHANRGNVAVICWNTLNTNTWSVNSETLDGEVSLGIGAETKTLLEINFTEFTCEDGALKEIESEDFEVAANNDRQLTLTLADTDETANFKFEKAPRKNADEASYYDSTDKKVVYIYVPEDVCEDLDVLENKNVTVILGEDNIAVAVIVNEDIEEKDYLTDYDAVKGKVTIGGVKYTLAEDSSSAYNYKAKLNGKDYTPTTYNAAKRPIEEALIALEIISGADESAEDIEKKIEATVTLNGDDEVKDIELFASATIPGVSKEVIVTKVKETSKKYTIYTTEGNITWDTDDEEDLEFPKVYVDGTKADIRDIEAGNVLTVYTAVALGDIENITKIYVSTETVTGDVTKIKKVNNAITLDGTVYNTSSAAVKMTTEELSKDEWNTFDSTKIIDSEEVTLLLNVCGEYAGVMIEEGTADYQFGVVTYVSSNVTFEGEDEEIAVKNIKILLPSGRKETFKMKVDTSDEDITATEASLATVGTAIENNFVMFEANSDNVITLEDLDEIVAVTGASTHEDYDFAVINPTDAVDGKTFAIGSSSDNDYVYNSNKTVIFNKHYVPSPSSSDKTKQEVVANWDSIVDSSNHVIGNAFAVFDADKDVALYIVVDTYNYADSDAEYALVASKAVEVADGKYEIDFVGQSDIEIKNETIAEAIKNIKGWLIKYTMSSGKISSATPMIDVDEFNDLDTDAAVTTEIVPSVTVGDFSLISSLTNVVKENLEVKEIVVDDKYASIQYADDVNENPALAITCGDYYEKSNDDYNKATAYNSSKTYYTVEATLASGTAVAGKDYYTKSSQNYVKAAVTTGDNVTGKYTLKITTVDMTAEDSTLGKVRLDDEHIVVVDLRNGTVEDADLSDIAAEVENGEQVYAILYKDRATLTRGTANVIVIL